MHWLTARTWRVRSLRQLLRLRWWWLAAAGAVLGAGAGWPTVVVEPGRENFSRITPHRLAGLLTDFNNHMEFYKNVGSWTVEEEASNVSSWSYAVQYECGRGCAGRARVALAERRAPDPASGLALRHGQRGKSYLVSVFHEQCSGLPYLPWIEFCDVWGSEGAVEAAQAAQTGATYRARAWRRCAALSALAGRCGAELRAAHTHLHHHLRTLQDNHL